ncbi:phosphate uptake regulator PhoU [Labilibaculum sp. DW002]|uniref:Phosphate uptake regulator PhoU n=1 Tax=Paralabilibaculum antarcticum TaxID=2912572 RepID=A0ABT5VLX0_9BACT|nr:phosphate uptake regulator PhoU [Labilibaculum sp. DW002]MDE5416418.1 phosphate uptake regulator PhoU [Labilibaculum sp. DW002]
MSIKKDKKFDKLDNDFAKMKSLVFQQFEILEEVVNNGLDEVEKSTIDTFNKNESKLDQFELKMSDNIIQTIGLQHPMARELRLLVSYFRMIGHVERIGDQLNNVMRFFHKMDPPNIPENQKDSVLNMLSLSEKMVKKALISFEDGDHEYAIWTIKNDEIVDEMQSQILKRMVRKNAPKDTDPTEIFNLLNFNSILGNIERIADNATNIAEAAIYYQQGIDLRHQELPEEDQ